MASADRSFGSLERSAAPSPKRCAPGSPNGWRAAFSTATRSHASRQCRCAPSPATIEPRRSSAAAASRGRSIGCPRSPRIGRWSVRCLSRSSTSPGVCFDSRSKRSSPASGTSTGTCCWCCAKFSRGMAVGAEDLERSVHQLVPNLAFGDAISQQALTLRGILRGLGARSEIFVENIDAQLRGEARPYRQLRDEARDGGVVLYHFSIGSEVTDLYRLLPNPRILVYHNITPPEFFRG